ncbi:MAG: hypothetical protein Q8Q09_00350 [Deltaproteobacteria bacterium]|nr:hypothetical protein [Deltaproteobacteria bacterium]
MTLTAPALWAQAAVREPVQPMFETAPSGGVSPEPVRFAEVARDEPDGIRRRLGFTLVAGGGGVFGRVSGPTWHAASVRLGAQIYSPLAIYAQSQLVLGMLSAPDDAGVLLSLQNSLLVELSVQNYVQFALGPSIDLLWQDRCIAMGCVVPQGVWLGLHQRVAVPLIARPVFGRTVGMRGPSRAIKLALDIHESLVGSLLITGTLALGIDWY